jgi:2-polyprenyl-6-methoxyphenol hydroxylase-like FAD-dependent oxidoreductase
MRIAIIGAGLAGLGAAAFLGRRGHEVTVLERAEQPRPVGAGLLLQPPGIAAMDELGAGEGLRRDAAHITRLEGRTPKGHILLDLDYGDLEPGLHGLGVTRPAIWSALQAAAVDAGASIHSGRLATAILENRSGASVVVAGQEDVDTDLVLVASGTHTAFWKAGIHHRSRPYPWGCMWATVELPSGWPLHVLGQRCEGTSVMLGILPISQGKAAGATAALYWSIRNDRAAEFMAQPAGQWHATVARVWPQAEEVVRTLEPARMVHAIYRDVWADPPHCGCVLAIGDAAHGTSPQLGQGTTGALRDARALADALDGPGPLHRQLETYWRERRVRTRYYRMASRVLTPAFQSSLPLLGAARDLLAAPAGRLLRRQALLTLAGAKRGMWTADLEI